MDSPGMEHPGMVPGIPGYYISILGSTGSIPGLSQESGYQDILRQLGISCGSTDMCDVHTTHVPTTPTTRTCRVRQIMLNSVPTAVLCYFNMLKILLIMPQICLLCSGRSKLASSNNHITLLHTSQLHHQPQTT